MPHLKIRFGEPTGGWMNFSIWEDNQEQVRYDVSDIIPSFDLLVRALLALGERETEATVTWALEPSEFDLLFLSQGDCIRLEVVPFPGSFRPYKNEEDTALLGSFRPRQDEKALPIFIFVGSYKQTCLPFWLALRELEDRYSAEELARRWTSPFPHKELALLTQKLGRN